MKGIIIGQKVSLGAMDFVHGGGHYMLRVLVPEAENLVFGLAEGNAFAFIGYNMERSKPDVIRDVDVPDAIVQAALAVAHADQNLQENKKIIKDLLK